METLEPVRLRTWLTKRFQMRGKAGVTIPLVYIVKEILALPITILPSNKEGFPTSFKKHCRERQECDCTGDGKQGERMFLSNQA